MKCCDLLLLAALASPVVRAAAHGGDMDMDMPAHSDEHHDSNSHDDAHTDAHSDAHDSMEMSPSPMSMEHHHGRPILDNPHLEPQQRKYWEQYNTTTFFNAEKGNKTLLYLHATFAFIAFGLMAPLSIILSTDSRAQKFYYNLQSLHLIAVLLSTAFVIFYATTAPSLYPGNIYLLFSVLITALTILQYCTLTLNMLVEHSVDGFELVDGEQNYEDSPMLPEEHHHRRHRHRAEDEDEEADSDDANAFALDDLDESRREPSLSSTEFGSGSETDLSSFDVERDPKRALGKNTGYGRTAGKSPVPLFVRKLFGNHYIQMFNSYLGRLTFHTLNFPLFLAGYGYLLTGLAIGFLMGKDKKVFGLLAHFIKGFVFFALGFVELARFFGMGSSRGWSWNQVAVVASNGAAARQQKSRLARIAGAFWPDHPTFEFLQSFLIFFYGATNVFLEHLGNEDGVWSHKDLQHASIAFMFFGGGLCGMILESNAVKRCISRAFSIDNADANVEVRRGYSLNPMPAFIIFWTGALMSHHQQETELSTQIHVLWGTMFSLGAVIRLITIGLLFTKPVPADKSEASKPQRPFTEVLVSFCLVCGGMIFMSSNRETVEGMIYRGMDQMFTLNVSVGITVLLMAYFVLCLAAKGLMVSRRI